MKFFLLCFTILSSLTDESGCFQANPYLSRKLTADRHHQSSPLLAASADGNDNDDLMKELAERTEKIRVEEMRKSLEDARMQRMLKSRPRKLPYADARIWVQANLGVDSKEEFNDFVANGNVRTPYIPKKPEQFYKATGEWKGWDHFLNAGALEPKTGILD